MKQEVTKGMTGLQVRNVLKNNFDELYGINSQRINVKDYGATGDGVTDDRDSIYNAIAASDGKPIYFPPGTYIVGSAIVFQYLKKDIHLFSDGNVTIICSAAWVLQAQTNIQSAGLRINANKYDEKVSIIYDLGWEVPLVEGDIVRLYSTALWANTSYPKGEMQRVRKVDMIGGGTYDMDNDVYFYEYLLDDYDMSNCLVRHLYYPRLTIRNIRFQFISVAAITGIDVGYMKDVLIDNVEISGARIAAIAITACYGVLINRLVAYKIYETGADFGYAYGVSVNSCQNVNIVNCEISGAKHGVMCGGTFPNRNIHISNCFISEQVNLHGNAEIVSIMDNTVYGVLTIWGKSCRIIGNNLYGWGCRPEFGRSSYAISIAPDPDYPDAFIVQNNKIINGNFMQFYCGGIHASLLEITGNSCQESGIIFVSQGTDVIGFLQKIVIKNNSNICFQNDRIVMTQMDVINNIFTGLTSYGVQAFLMRGIVAPNVVGCLLMVGNVIDSYIAGGYPILIGDYASPLLPQLKQAIIKGNVIRSDYGVTKGKWCDIVVTDYVELSCNTFMNMEAPVKIANSLDKCYFDNNVLIDCTGAAVNDAAHIYTNATPE